MVFLEYISGKSIFHKVDIRAKIIWLLLVMVLAIIFNDPVFLASLLFFVFLSGAIARVPYNRIWRMLKPLLPVILFIIVFTGFTTSGESPLIFEVLGLRFTFGGLLVGTSFVLRLGIFVVSLSVITLTTSLDAFLELLMKMRAPYGLARAFATGIRFVPTIEKELQTVLDAQKVRGVELEKMGFIKRLRTHISALIPMFVGGVRRSEILSQALLARGFGALKRRPSFYKLKMDARSYVFAGGCAGALIVGIYLRLLGFGILGG